MSEETPKADVAADVIAKFDTYTKKADTLVEKGLGFISDHPWEEWLKVANTMVARFLPAVIIIMGAVATLIGLISSIKMDMPFSMVMSNFAALVGAVFSMHLAPRAMALTRSFIDKKEPDQLRPEFLYILKVLLGLGGFVLGIVALLNFTGDTTIIALILFFLATIFTIVFANPALIGIKEGYPANAAEEAITVSLLLVKIILALLTLIVAAGTLGAFVYGIYTCFDSGPAGAFILTFGAMIPLVLPLAVYLGYLLFMFWFEICRAIVCLPRKLGELADKLSK